MPPSIKRHPYIADFFIVGAMKAATTSLHHWLASHPDIFIPRNEVFFFDVDDFLQHPPFFCGPNDTWCDRDFAADQQVLLDWYADFFREAKPGQLLGDHSTTYLASDKAAGRIAAFNPDARIFIALRNPVDRTYSAYWHLVCTGQAILSFEDTLRSMPEPLLQRSLYKPQVERYLNFFARDRIRFVLFEDFVAHPDRVAHDAFRFLGLPPATVAPRERIHYKPGRVPRWPGLELWWNRHRLKHEQARWHAYLPGRTERAPSTTPDRSLLDRIYRRANPLRRDLPPPMRTDTRELLTSLLRRENAGLDRLVERDLDLIWFGHGGTNGRVA